MSDQVADVLLAAARELRLRRYMGPIPFDADEWIRQGSECDLPRLEDGETEYHFEVRTREYEGTYFTLGLDGDGKPDLVIGSIEPDRAGPYSADLDGWRAVATEINRFAPTSVVEPRKYIWLTGHAHIANKVDSEHRARLDQAVAHVFGLPQPPKVPAAEPAPRTSFLRSVACRFRRRGTGRG